jgi:hypothetical protein
MVRVDGSRLVDELGGTLILRGANLGGSSKLPVRGGAGDSRDVSFVGRPFPLSEAEEHFRRLRDWGLLFNRFLVTWEAVEHRGPGEYDREYLDYLEAVIARGAALGLRFVVDFHQDVWSRFTGGDGAPGWTLELAGLNARTLRAAGAAVLHGGHGDRPTNLAWPTNNWRLGAATMATLFFAGDVFAPDVRVGTASIQAFLQSRYAGFARAVAARLARIDAVTGFDLMNEPPAGFVGYPDLASDRSMFVRSGPTPTPFDSMAAASGFPREVPVCRQTLLGVRRTGRSLLNPRGASAWLPGFTCPWLRHGVWADRGGTPALLRPDYFAVVDGRRVCFGNDFLRPLLARVGREVRAVHPGALLFIEDSPQRRQLHWSPADGTSAVYAPHWYDGLTMLRKHFTPWLCIDERTQRPAFGSAGVRRSFRRQLGAFRRDSAERLDGIPSFVGEFGLPFDLDGGAAFRTGEYASQARALEAYHDALDANLSSGTLWNYTSDNTTADGDGWNGEDFSVFCRESGGGRAVEGFSRPYATRVPGVAVRMRYDPDRRRFALAYRNDLAAQGDAEIFIPSRLASGGLAVQVSDGSWRHDAEGRTLIWSPDSGRPVHEVVVAFRPAASAASRRPGARSSR